MTEQELKKWAEKIAGSIIGCPNGPRCSSCRDGVARELADFRQEVLREALESIDSPCEHGCGMEPIMAELERLAAGGE